MSQAELIDQAVPAREAETAVVPLSAFRVGDVGSIVRVGGARPGVDDVDLERRLLELGFVEGARIELLHEGLIGRDPIAVRLDDMRVALRRREAACVQVQRAERRA